MRFGIRGPRFLAAQRRGAFRPKAEALEDRLLLAIDLGGTTPPTLPTIATHPYGVDMVGGQSGGGAGFSVHDVGDVNGDGFDDFLIGGPTVVSNGGQIGIGNGGNSRAYLVFGSRAVNAGNVDWLTLNAVQRVGDLGQLGNSSNGQQNPITGATGFPFDGITFFTSQNPNSQLGASVAAVGTVNGAPAFLIGAPGASDANAQNPGTGRAYLIYGGLNLNVLSSKTIDLDNPAGNQGLTFVTFTLSGTAGVAHVGRAVAGPGDVLADGSNDVAIGAPNATINGNANAGAVYLLDGFALPATTSTVNLNTVGQPGGRRGVLFGGVNSGDNAGFSVAGAGSVDGALSAGNARIQDLLIGAPGASTAYLVYGSTNLIGQATNVGGTTMISLGRLGTPGSATGVVTGAIFTGTALDGTGFAVSSAGDFNNDGLSDFLIGSPFFQAQTGQATLFYGQPQSGTPITGNIPLNNIPTNFPNAQFVGTGPGDLAGYALSLVGRITASPANPILIGSPGFNADAGAAYLIPGNPGLFGQVPLSTAESSRVAGTRITLTTPGVTPEPFFGASVSGRLIESGQRVTADNDLIADFIIGAPGYNAATGRVLNGGALILEGHFVPLGTPVSNTIVTQIGVGQPFGPFVVNPTTPTTLQIFVFSNANVTPAFDPVRDIDPTTVVINGVRFPNATITKDPVDENKDGIEDAIITITPRSNIGLTTATTTFTISGQTLASSPNANKTWTGTAAITVSGAPPTPPVGPVGFAPPIGLIPPTTFVAPYGPGRFSPAVSTLSRLDYKAIPFRIAMQQFLPPPEFRQRMLNFFFPREFHFNRRTSSRHFDKGGGVYTNGQHTFDTSKYHDHKVVTFNHHVQVIPTNRQTERGQIP
jgi:hypothetical protein